MRFVSGQVYHLYNQGNNKQVIFFNENNYHFFIRKMANQLGPVCHLLAWCLMPTHFHILVQANEKSVEELPSYGGKPMQVLARRIGDLLGSYSQAINKQNHTTGSLFRQKTKAVRVGETLESSTNSSLLTCFFYIHNNPVKAGLVSCCSDWLYSSYHEYTRMSPGIKGICEGELFLKLSGTTAEEIKNQQ